MTTHYSIGEMARLGHCKVQTLRYYEQIGLLPEPARSPGNQRIYTDLHRERLLFIRHSRELGFSLDQIREILALTDQPNQSCVEIDAIARAHLIEVESKILRLESMQQELRRMITECGCNRVADCQIVKVLSDHSLCLHDKH